MLAVVAMAADLTTGVTFKGTWGDKLGDYPTAEGEITVTKVDEGLKFEVKSNGFNGYAFPAYTVVYKSDVAEDGSFNTGDYYFAKSPETLQWTVFQYRASTGSRSRVLLPTSHSTSTSAIWV